MTIPSFEEAQANVARHARRTPLISSQSLSDATGFDVRLKAEVLQRTGSYKLRGPLNKLAQLTPEERERGVICSSAGNHAQGVALAAALFGVRAVVVMAENATPTKINATRGYGAQVVLHGAIWDEANEKALQIVAEQGLTYIHPFDDLHLIAGQGTVGIEILEDLPDADVVIVPIGGGGLISGVSAAIKGRRRDVTIIGVESEGAPAMKLSVEAGRRITLEQVDCRIDGLTVKRVGEHTLEIVRQYVDEIVTLPDDEIFEAVLWTMSRTKLVVEAAAASTVAALLNGRVDAPPGSKVVCVLSGGNLNLDQLRGMRWN